MKQSIYKITILTFILSLVSCQLQKTVKTSDRYKLQETNALQSCGFFKRIFKKPEVDPVYSRDTVLFGTEIEFPLRDASKRYESTSIYRQTLLTRCKSCANIRCDDDQGHVIIETDGQKLKVFIHPDEGVVEINTQPLTYSETEGWANILDKLIFGTAEELLPSVLADSDGERNRWSGHINISWPGLRSINVNATLLHSAQDQLTASLLVNFYIDSQNHPELALGVLGGDSRNATPLAFGEQNDRNRLREIRNAFQSGNSQNFSALIQKLWVTIPNVRHSYSRDFGSYRYVLVNVQHLIGGRDHEWSGYNGQRLELRGFFTPRNSGEMLANYRVINARLAYLYNDFVKKNLVVAYDDQLNYKPVYKPSGLADDLTPQRAAAVYVKYLSESGLNPYAERKFLRDSSIINEVKEVKKSKPGRIPCFTPKAL
jgi:hypothetical protein